MAEWRDNSRLTPRNPPRGSVRCLASVTGPVYTSEEEEAPIVTLFTKEGCTLCDKVKEVLRQAQQENHVHSLEQIDITDENHQEWFDKYKYDIPVLHINGQYWLKHKLSSVHEVQQALEAVRNGSFTSPVGEPNAAAMERKYNSKKS
eukprot:CAMPEP_0172450208 /NCGR_PEP_ID=MMETSP1065-20121228/8653_1 /TAXON_ID=265537 /ORGANISM="Amphiprora paludosa, Strain CCMP125" /LENGTH=146 /DNA_ID=CAMNT_0013201985 /DNA_START=138 /DNA_END=578 /DNA_ORIENTATION=-